MQYKISILSGKICITYFGELYKNNSNKVYIVYGFGKNWEDTNKREMFITNEGYTIVIDLKNFDILNFCFTNENNVWDNNNGNDYTVYVAKDILEGTEEEKMDKKETIEEIRDNGILLISEVQGKIILPYKAEEVEEILKVSNEYETVQEVIDNVFVKPFGYYNNQFVARFREAVKLVSEREKMSIFDGINLGIELFKKRYLHPAIISACKNLDELNVYLDCLEKNELDDFKIFDIVYEISPVIVNKNDKW